MYLLNELVKNNRLLIDKLFEEVSDIDIYCELIGEEIPIGSPIRSPIRDDDSSPSFSLFFPTKKAHARTEELWWTDFTLGSGDVFAFVQQFALFHNDLELTTSLDILTYIDDAMGLGLFDSGQSKITYNKRDIDYDIAKETKLILFKSRGFTKLDIFWWLRYGIDQPLLTEHNVRSLHYLLNNDYTIRYTYRATELGFVYVVYDKVKVYSPHGGDFKWRNTCPAHYILGEEQLRGKEVLIVTKSLKDIMTFKSFLDVDVISPQSESTGFSEEKLEFYRQNYKYRYVVMDWDDTGRASAAALEKEGFTVVWVDTKEIHVGNKIIVKDKDISDYVHHNGIEAGFLKLKAIFPKLPEKFFREDRVDYLLKLKENLSL